MNRPRSPAYRFLTSAAWRDRSRFSDVVIVIGEEPVAALESKQDIHAVIIEHGGGIEHRGAVEAGAVLEVGQPDGVAGAAGPLGEDGGDVGARAIM